MKIKTSEALGWQLDWAVAKAEGLIDDCNTWLHEAAKRQEVNNERPRSV